MMKRKILAIASSGGHFVQLRRLISQLETNPGIEVFSVSTWGENGEELFPSDHYIKDVSRSNPLLAFRVALEAYSILRARQPTVVLTTGAMPGLIFVFVARLLRVQTIWLDSIANTKKLSLSGRVAAKVSNITLTQWPHLASERVFFHGSVL